MTSADQFVLKPVARLWLSALALGVVVAYGAFFVFFLDRSGPGDADQFVVFHTLQYWNAGLFGLAKQWTPLLCSGLSMAGEPQIPFMSLSMALSYGLGPFWGVKCALFIYVVLGWIGAFLYAGLWLRVREQRVLAAALFIGNGFFFCRLGMGHFDFVPFLILPLLLWALHRGIRWNSELRGADRQVRLLLTVLLLGASLALVIDGSPVAIIHLALWISLYAATLSVVARSATPAVLWACSVALALCLDAGYLWPMLQAQASFPRLTPDRFTSALSLLWFAILPLRGKVLPANGNGHEMSVFIGPILAYCLWSQRHWLARNLPVEMRQPLLVVSVVSVVLGMGSLKALHVPMWLSPFDLLRPLPGFRSIGVTGRYWGFLALPLSLLGAVALYRWAAQLGDGWRLHAGLGCALLFQLCFQAETLTTHWLHSAPYRPVSYLAYFKHGPEVIDYVESGDKYLQGELLTPTRGVCDCYDMDDFTHAQTGPGSNMVLRTSQDGAGALPAAPIHAQFATWQRIRLTSECQPNGNATCVASSAARIRVTLKQAYHSNWSAPGCATYANPLGNLVVDCPAASLLNAPIELVFHDATSALGARISMLAWAIWLWAAGAAILAGKLMSGRALSGKLAGFNATKLARTAERLGRADSPGA